MIDFLQAKLKNKQVIYALVQWSMWNSEQVEFTMRTKTKLHIKWKTLASKVNEECRRHYFYAHVVTICYASERWRVLALWLYNNQ